MRIIDGRTIEVDCISCAVTFLTGRGEDGEPDEELCPDCWETLEDHRRTLAQERDRVWFETFLSFPFKQLPAPRCEHCNINEGCYECGGCPEHCECEEGFYECTCELRGDEQIPWDCRIHGQYGTETRREQERAAAAEAAYYSSRWEDGQ